MPSVNQPSFDLRPHVKPSYIEPILLQMEEGIWYGYSDLRRLLREFSDVDGTDIVRSNVATWILLGLLEAQVEASKRTKSVALTSFGKWLIDVHSTNSDLFFDMIHFRFYSAWPSTQDLSYARFWLYTNVCNMLWQRAPDEVQSNLLANQLVSECRATFPNSNPTFQGRSVRSVYLWLSALTPAFLEKCATSNLLCSKRRRYCTPQLFHLATDLIYTTEGLQYGTAMAMGDKNIEAICKVCLLDPERFWQMADLTKMTIRGFELQRGQWGSGIVLNGPPEWIDLPTYTVVEDAEVDAGDDTEDDLYDEEA